MKIQVLHEAFSICRLRRMPAAGKRWHFLAVTDEEISLVCPTAEAPEDAEKRDDGWRAFRVEGTLDFSLVAFWRTCPPGWQRPGSAFLPCPPIIRTIS